ncbi:MAG: SoxR reducing system RseC family protein [Gammaproteobacteria bacterium]|nr:SoxR reducing system RseC family protein [Gammaproteobacteria bacterium]
MLRVADGVAWLRCESQAGCQRCAEGRGCGGGIFSRLLGDRLQEIPVNVTEPVAPDDWVMVGLEPVAVQNAAFLMYGLPLALLLVGAIAGDWIGGDLPALLGSASGLVAGFALARYWSGQGGRGHRYQPVMLRRLEPGEPCPSN